MLDLLNNPWVVGIGGGILSGLAVALITRMFLEKKDDRELLEKVTAANKELIYAIRPCIAEGAIPSLEVIESLVASTARKYSLAIDKLSTPQQLIDDLVKEVMDSSFISASIKAEYCSKLNTIDVAKKPSSEIPEEIYTIDSAKTYAIAKKNISQLLERERRDKEYRQRLLTMASTMMGIMATVMTFSYVIINNLKISLSSLIEPYQILLPALATMIAVTISLAVVRVLSRINKLRVKKRGNNDENDVTISENK